MTLKPNQCEQTAGSPPLPTTPESGSGKCGQAERETPHACDSAVAVREQWMRLMRMAEDEIRESCAAHNGPFNLDEELKELASAQEFAKNRLSYEELNRLAQEGGSLRKQS